MRFRVAIGAVVLATIAASLAACSSTPPARPGPTKAADRAAAERAASGEEPVAGEDKSWGGWRYQGSRDDCFFVVERECFATLESACEATECKEGCVTRGAGPATVYCK